MIVDIIRFRFVYQQTFGIKANIDQISYINIPHFWKRISCMDGKMKKNRFVSLILIVIVNTSEIHKTSSFDKI